MLDIDKRRQPATLLRLRDNGESQRRFAGRLRTVNFHDTSARKTANAERAIDQNISRRNDLDVDDLLVAETHDRAITVVFCDLLNGQVEVLVTRSDELVFAGFFFGFSGHKRSALT